MDLIQELESRGFLHQVTDRARFDAHLATGCRAMYCGYDPTADSLQIGNLVPLMMKAHAQRAGHKPVVVAGGATGLIGDPSGKSQERPLLGSQIVESHVAAQHPIFETILDFDEKRANAARWFNNQTWLGQTSMIEFLRDYGKHFSVNQMLTRENVRNRLEQREQGISFTEFSYGLLQAIDFLHLYTSEHVTIQVGGSDQWGNIVGGIDLVRRVTGAQVFGITAPLITRADGQKFGKTEDGSIWLTSERTSPFAYYQFWFSTADADLEDYLKIFTFLSLEDIREIVVIHKCRPEQRYGQRHLAYEATRLLHGDPVANRAVDVSKALFDGALSELFHEDLLTVFKAIPSSTHELGDLVNTGLAMTDLLLRTGICSSRREAREFLNAGAIRLNGQRVHIEERFTSDQLMSGEFTFISRGKKLRHLTRWI